MLLWQEARTIGIGIVMGSGKGSGRRKGGPGRDGYLKPGGKMMRPSQASRAWATSPS
ncbi:hypothetical protein [Streptomyces sp. CB01201]|uniref:hypothetical protein n=1 Tax=Streptomyces sp. CB01201 TaxID=2020324 RepID=UPI00131AF94D|nr:hypothetical protein [Streptomyces sp. CB01201]